VKTTVEYTSGECVEWADTSPSIITGEEGTVGTVTMIDAEAACVSDDIPLTEVKRVVFEP
jgi:hypothetical protein